MVPVPDLAPTSDPAQQQRSVAASGCASGLPFRFEGAGCELGASAAERLLGCTPVFAASLPGRRPRTDPHCHRTAAVGSLSAGANSPCRPPPRRTARDVPVAVGGASSEGDCPVRTAAPRRSKVRLSQGALPPHA